MPHRRRRPSATALLTALLLLAFSAPAWAQGDDEPASSDEPAVEAEGTGSEGAESDGCPSGQVRNVESGECERDRDCSEFDTREEAQDFFESRGEDPHLLDEDPGEDDGQACEDLPSEGSDDDDTPSGSVDSGYGPVAREPKADAPPPIALVGTGLGVLALVGLGLGVARTSARGVTSGRETAS